MEKENNVKVSIIIPIHNLEQYVGDCIESAINQTLKEIEIICFDDASTDNSPAIIEKYSEKDSRVKIVTYPANKSASQARKDGVLQASGKYIMFLDGDDYLEPNACEKLYDVISNENVDMVHFGTNIINSGNVTEKRIKSLEKRLSPYNGKLDGENVFKACFIDKKYRFSIWNKIYKAELCKEAFQSVKDGNFPKAQDLYAFFILCYHAKSYYGIEEKFYNYRFGAGITCSRQLSIMQLDRYCTALFVAEAIHDFLLSKDEKRYLDISAELRENLVTDCIEQWYTAININDSAAGFDVICKYWNSIEVVSNLCKRHYREKKQIAEKVFGAESIKCTAGKEIKTIGIYYHRYALGGVQRVISCLIPIYLEMGYKVVLLTDEISEGDEYELPDEVTRIVLPSALAIKKDEYEIRAKELLRVISENKIDVICYQAASCPKLIYDILLLKLNGVPIVLTVHECAFQNMLTLNTEMVNRPSVYKLVDYMTVLSRVEELYWQGFGINAVYIPNPITNQIVDRQPEEIEKNTIVWVGRLDTRTKRCLDVIDIMKYVIEDIPDAKLLVVGNEVSAGIVDQMQNKIGKMGMERNIVLCGHTTDVESYYRKAEIYLLTSISESFSMTIAESKAFGLPLVLYEMPFLEFCRDKRGYLSAPQGDKRKMAENIVNILTDEGLKAALQKEAQESLRAFGEYDLKGAWNNVFLGLSKPHMSPQYDENFCILLNSMLQHYNYGATVSNNEKKGLKKNISKLSNQLNESKNAKKTWEYRLGHILLYIPRQIISKTHQWRNKLPKMQSH